MLSVGVTVHSGRAVSEPEAAAVSRMRTGPADIDPAVQLTRTDSCNIETDIFILLSDCFSVKYG